MRLGQTQERLRTMLRVTELDLERLDPRGTWNVFKLFAAEPVEGAGPAADDDMCLFEYGVYDWSDGRVLASAGTCVDSSPSMKTANMVGWSS